MSNKVIYLKSLFGKLKEDNKVQDMITDCISNAYGYVPKEAEYSSDEVGRMFIMDNAKDFLEYAIDYSVADKFYDYQ